MPTCTRLICAFTWGGWVGLALAAFFAIALVRAALRMDGTSTREAHAIGFAIALMATVEWLMVTFR